MGVIFRFLGLSFTGFRRQNKFLAFCVRFRYSRYMRNSITYFMAIIISVIWVFSSDFKYIYECNHYLNRIVFPIKLFANKVLEFPVNLSEYLIQNQKLKEHLQKIKIENDELKIALTTISDLKNELDELKKAINFKYTISNYKTVERVLGFDKGIYESFMLISVTHDETRPGSVVISSNGLVGIIYDIQNTIARVMHICDQKTNIPVVSESGEHLILTGNNSRIMFSKEIDSKVNTLSLKSGIGELLVTSGEGGVFQSGIPVARITGIDNESVKAVPIEKLDDIVFVWIIRPVIR